MRLHDEAASSRWNSLFLLYFPVYMKRRLFSILFWSVITAAFIGPGTLVTASKAGAGFGLSLSWALVFATIACIVFQEMSARLTIVTGHDLAETLSTYMGRKWLILIPLGVILGCVAYEAGNILGAVIGLKYLLDIDTVPAILLVVGLAGSILLMNSLRWIASVLGGMVVIMGFSFLFVAVKLDVSLIDLFKNILTPSIPSGADWVILGLIGTTVVPYNLFLGSGISHTDSVPEMRFGLIFSIVLGGLVSIAILVTGTVMTQTGGLTELIEVAGATLGSDMKKLIALGLFAAGFTSAVTAPLAAGLIVKGLVKKHNMAWVRRVSLTVLFTGALAGILEYTPEVIILAAQGVNGLILPLATAILWYITNQPGRMGQYVTPGWVNVLAFLLMNVLITLGVRNILTSLGEVFGTDLTVAPLILLFVSLPVTGLLAYFIMKSRVPIT